MRRFGVLLACVAGLAVINVPGASAHRSPANCVNNGGVNITFGSPAGVLLRNGDEMTLTATVPADNTAGRCDITDATVFAKFPNPDGTLSQEEVVIATGMSFQPGVATPVPGNAKRVIQFDPGVFVGEVAVGYRGTLHADPHTQGFVQVGQPNGPRISRPVTEIVVQAVPVSGPPPLMTTYNYAVTNTSPAVVPREPGDPPLGVPTPTLNPNIDREILAGTGCTDINFSGIDLGADSLLSSGETWHYQCQREYLSPGPQTATATIVDSISMTDNRPWPADAGQATVLVQEPDMTIAKSHTGSFPVGSKGQVYSITARNDGTGPTTGAVTVADQLPSGLTATSIAGEGWTCNAATLECERSDPLAAGQAYPPIVLTVDVTAVSPGSVTNTATVVGGGESDLSDNTAEDPTVILEDGHGEDPSNEFSSKIGKRHADGGVTLNVKVPGPGQLTADDAPAKAAAAAKGKKNLIKKANATATKAGTVKLRLKPTKKLKKLLRVKPRKVGVKTTFTPTGGTAASQVKKIKFKLPR